MYQPLLTAYHFPGTSTNSAVYHLIIKTKNKKPTLFCVHLFLISSLYLLSIFLSFLESLFYFFNTGYKTCVNEFTVKCGH